MVVSVVLVEQVLEPEQVLEQVLEQAKEAVRVRARVRAVAKDRATLSTFRKAPLPEHPQLSLRGTLWLEAANRTILSLGADALPLFRTTCSPFQSNSGRWLRSTTKPLRNEYPNT